MLKKTKKRGRLVANKPWKLNIKESQEIYRNACFRISKYLQKRGVPVIRINNVNSINSTLTDLKKSLSECIQ